MSDFSFSDLSDLVNSPITSDVTSLLSGNPVFDFALSGVNSTSGSSSNNGYTSERLFLSRPRWTSPDTQNRGAWSYIKLMTSSQQASSYSSQSSSRTNSGNSCTPASSALAESLALMSSGNSGSGYDKFLLTGVSADMSEKLQIMETFGDTEVVYFFGRAPMIFTFSGLLVDSPDNSWFSDWLYTYEGSFRGTKLAQNRELLKIVLPSMTLTGVMTEFGWEQQAQNDVSIPFRFQFLVRSLTPTPAMPISSAITNSAQSINFTNMASFQSQTGINGMKAQISGLMGVLQNPGSTLGALGSALGGFGGGIAGTSSAVSDFIDGLTADIQGAEGGIASFFSPIMTTINGIRASLFSPIFGVLNSLSKLVTAIFGSGGLSSLFSALTSPIRNILGDITRIATQATAIVAMTEAGLSNLGRGLSTGFGVTTSYKNAIASFEHTMGTITNTTLDLGTSVSSLYASGFIPSSAAFLVSNAKLSLGKPARLSSGASIGHGSGASLSSGTSGLSMQQAILSGRYKKTISTTGAYV